MANRRMISKDVIDTDRFLDMPATAQNLYFHLNLHADDDGFVSAPKKIQRMVGAGDDDFKLLIAKNFIIPFESGVIVLVDWLLNNQIQNDRYHPTVHKTEKSFLSVDPDNRHIRNSDPVIPMDRIDKTLRPPKNKGNKKDGTKLDTERIQDGTKLDTQYSIEQDSKGKAKEVKDSKEQSSRGEAKQKQEQTRLEDPLKKSATASPPSQSKISLGVLNTLEQSQEIEQLERLCDYFEFNIEEVGKPGRAQIKNMVKLLNYELVDYAVKVTLPTRIEEREHEGDPIRSPLAYLQTIINDWKSKGFTKSRDVRLYDTDQEDDDDEIDYYEEYGKLGVSKSELPF